MKINKVTKMGILSGILILLATIFIILGVGFVRGGCGGEERSKSEGIESKQNYDEVSYLDVGEEERFTEEDIETDKFLINQKAREKTEKGRKSGIVWARAYPKRGITGNPVNIKGQILGYKMGKLRIVAGQKMSEKKPKIILKKVAKKGKFASTKTKVTTNDSELKSKKVENNKKSSYKKLNLRINDTGAFTGVFVPNSGGTYIVSIGVEDFGSGYISIHDESIDVTNTGIPDIDITGFTGASDPTIDTGIPNTNPFPCVQTNSAGGVPPDEVFSLHFREEFVGDMIKLHLSRYLSERSMCSASLYPDSLSQEFFQSGTHDFTGASQLGEFLGMEDFLGMEIEDVVFTMPFDLRSLLNQAIAGDEDDIPNDAENVAELLSSAAAEVRIPASSVTINWENMINSISVDFIEYDPSVKVWFSANANISVEALISIVGVGNPLELIYQLLFPAPPYLVNSPILLSNITARFEGVADISGGTFTNFTLSIEPTGTFPWELAEVDSALALSITPVEAWIAGIVSQLTAVAACPILGSPGAADELCSLLNLIPIIGPALPVAVSVAAPFAGTILWLGTLPLTDPDRSLPFDVSTLSFNDITSFGLRHIMLSSITNLVQDTLNGYLASLNFNSWLSNASINQEELAYTLTLGPKRMNANYPENTNFSLLGGSFTYSTPSIPGASASCMVGTAPSVSPTIQSDMLGNPAAIDIAWTSMTNSPWGVSVNFHEKLLQGIINNAAQNGAFCNNSPNNNSNPAIISAVYPQLILSPTALALPITIGVPITAGSLLFNGASGAPGVVFSVLGYQISMNLEADFNIVVTNSDGATKLNFTISNFIAENILIAGLDPVNDSVQYGIILGMIESQLEQLVYDASQFGFTGIELPFSENCLELVGYGAWGYCDRPDRAMGLMIRSNSSLCPEIECPEINTTQL